MTIASNETTSPRRLEVQGDGARVRQIHQRNSVGANLVFSDAVGRRNGRQLWQRDGARRGQTDGGRVGSRRLGCGLPCASASHTTSVIGHPLGGAVAKRLFIGADPSSVAVTDDGIFGVSATGRVGLVTRLSLDGATQFPSIGIQTAALNFLIVAPKRGGGTVVVTNIGGISSSYWFLDVKTNTVIDSITTTRYVQGAAMTADGSRAYFLLDAGELAVLDVATHQFLPSIPLGGGVTSFRPAAGDTLAFARSDVGTMLEIDLKNGRVRRQYQFPAYLMLSRRAISRRFYVIDAPAGLVRVLRASDLSQQISYATDATRIAVPSDTKAMVLSIGDRVEVATGDVVTGFYPTARYFTSGVPSRVLFSTDGSVADSPTRTAGSTSSNDVSLDKKGVLVYRLY